MCNNDTLLFWCFRGNPYSCDKSLCWIFKAEGIWLTLYKRDEITCASPGCLAGQFWDDLIQVNFDCGRGEHLGKH